MSKDDNLGFGKFVPGFDFLQHLAKGASMPQMPSLSNWIAPTLNVEELEKRIGELKAVHFWLDQNSKALGATIQALEVQKMTLATLKGMNVDMAEVADAFRLKATDAMFGGMQKMGGSAEAARQASSPEEAPPGGAGSKPARKSAQAGSGASGLVDPLQWWGALTQQFQQIAASAMKDVASHTPVDAAREMATGMVDQTMKTAAGMARTASKTMAGAARKAPAKRPARKTKAARR